MARKGENLDWRDRSHSRKGPELTEWEAGLVIRGLWMVLRKEEKQRVMPLGEHAAMMRVIRKFLNLEDTLELERTEPADDGKNNIA